MVAAQEAVPGHARGHQPRRQCLGMVGGIPKSLEKREAAADSRAVFHMVV